jgi:hypothetical protein
MKCSIWPKSRNRKNKSRTSTLKWTTWLKKYPKKTPNSHAKSPQKSIKIDKKNPSAIKVSLKIPPWKCLPCPASKSKSWKQTTITSKEPHNKKIEPSHSYKTRKMPLFSNSKQPKTPEPNSKRRLVRSQALRATKSKKASKDQWGSCKTSTWARKRRLSK